MKSVPSEVKMGQNIKFQYFSLILTLSTFLVLAEDLSHNRAWNQEVYIWQRKWDPSVLHSIDQFQDRTPNFIALAAEVSWKNGEPHVISVPIPYKQIKERNISLGLAIRIGPFSGPFSDQDSNAQLLKNILSGVREDCKEVGFLPSEIQIDLGAARIF